MVLEYCVDSYFMSYIDRVYRRILLVYPRDMCRPVPNPNTYTVRANPVEAEDVFRMLVEACRRAGEEAFQPRARGPLRTLILGHHPDDLARIEAYNAWSLCATVFGDREDGYLHATLFSKAASYIEYPVGVVEDTGWRRLRSLARLEPRVAEEIERILREAGYVWRSPTS